MRIIGHRGAAGLALENTIPSIRAALKAGVDEIEIDVRITSDGVAVLGHDPDLQRVAQSPLVMSQSTYKELRQAFPELTSLKEAINLVNGQVPLMVEVKPDVATDPIVALLKQELAGARQPSDFLLASFSQKTLLQLHTELPEIQKVVIERFLSVRARWRAKQLGTNRLNMNQKFIWFGFVWAISKKYDLYPYSIDNPAKAKRWARFGLAGCITNYPDRYKN